MPTYNVGDRIRPTLDSLALSTEPFDLYIVDDGSQPPLEQTLSAPPACARILRLDRNVGIAAALNHGLAEILKHDYTYIARMDAGDVAHPERFKKQVDFLETHPQIGLVGCRVNMIDDDTRATLFYQNNPTTDADMRKALYFNMCIINSSMMCRADTHRKVGGYSTDYPICEGYEIVLRIARVTQMANLPEYWMECEFGPRGVSIAKRRTQQFSRLRLQVRHLQPLQWRAWVGIAKSIVLLVSPTKLIHGIKGSLKRYQRLELQRLVPVRASEAVDK